MSTVYRLRLAAQCYTACARCLSAAGGKHHEELAPQMFAALVFLAGVLAGGIGAVAGFGIGSLLTPLLALETEFKVAVAAVSIPHVLGTALRFRLLRRHIAHGCSGTGSDDRREGRSRSACGLSCGYAPRRRRALLTTDTELSDIAPAAINGDSSTPKNG